MRILIVDDELPARRKIKHFLLAHPYCQLLGEASHGPEAVSMIVEHNPDLIFLDINLPGLDGFQVLNKLPAKNRPDVIFATAYDRFAVHAFDHNAIDYLLKPFDRARFDEALKRVSERKARGSDQGLAALLSSLVTPPEYPSQLLVQDRARYQVVAVDEIDWIESASNYILLHVGKNQHVMRSTMTEIESRLDPHHFVRVHRQHIVNLRRIREIQPHFRGDMMLKLQCGTEVKLSRRYKDHFLGLLQR